MPDDIEPTQPGYRLTDGSLINEIIAAVNALGGNVFGPSGPDHSIGLVPDPGTIAGNSRFLCENATWDTPDVTAGFTAINPPGIALDGVTDASVGLQEQLDEMLATGGGTLKLIAPDGALYINQVVEIGSHTTLDLTECPVYYGAGATIATAGDLDEEPDVNKPLLYANILAGATTFDIVVKDAVVTPTAGQQFILRGERDATGKALVKEDGFIFSATDIGPVSNGERWTIVPVNPIENDYDVHYPLNDSGFTIAIYSAFTGNVNAGATSVVVADSSIFEVGDYVYVSDSETVGNAVNIVGYTDNNTINNEVNRIVAIDGGTDTITFQNALFHSYTTAYYGGITRILITKNAHIIGADISFPFEDGGTKKYGLMLKYSVDCSIQGCEIAYTHTDLANYGPYANGFRVQYALNCDVLKNVYGGKPDASIYTSGQGYGFVGVGATSCRFLGNTSTNARHGVLLQGGSAGNEVANHLDTGSRVSGLDTHGINATGNHIHDCIVIGGPLFSSDSANKAAIRLGNTSHLYGDFNNTVENIEVYGYRIALGVHDGYGIDIVPESAGNIVRNITIHGANYGVRSRYITAHDTAATGQNLVENVQVYDYDNLYSLDGGPNGVVKSIQLRNVTAPVAQQGASTENTVFDYAPGNPNLSAYISGLFYPAIPIVSFSNKTITAGRLYAVGPFTAQDTITISKLGVNVVTASAANKSMAIGVYTDSGNFPSAKIGANGTVLTDSSSADAEVTGLSIPIVKGAKYWIVANFEGTPVINAAGSTTAFRYPMVTSITNPAFLVKKTAAYSATLPATFPSSTVSDFAAETAPHLWFRF